MESQVYRKSTKNTLKMNQEALSKEQSHLSSMCARHYKISHTHSLLRQILNFLEFSVGIWILMHLCNPKPFVGNWRLSMIISFRSVTERDGDVNLYVGEKCICRTNQQFQHGIVFHSIDVANPHTRPLHRLVSITLWKCIGAFKNQLADINFVAAYNLCAV